MAEELSPDDIQYLRLATMILQDDKQEEDLSIEQVIMEEKARNDN